MTKHGTREAGNGDLDTAIGVLGQGIGLFGLQYTMSFFKDFLTPKQEPGPPLSVVLHPYYPQSLLLPGYEPLTIPFEQILGTFFGASAIVFIAVWLASGALSPLIVNFVVESMAVMLGRRHHHLRLHAGRVSHFGIGDRLTLTWLVITGIIHMLVEGEVHHLLACQGKH